MGTRHFFSELSWHIAEGGRRYPVFNQDEITNTPLKWLKHLLLVYVGLREIDELHKEIHRFPMTRDGLIQARKVCSTILDNSEPETILIVLKIIFQDRTMGLPNYRITAIKQIKPTFGSIELAYLNKVDELWLCKSDISRSSSNFGGRVTFRLDTTWMHDVIEIIWYTSPRMLDQCQFMDFPHLRASRRPGALSFVIDDFYVPKAFSNKQLKQNLSKDYEVALLELYKRREKIDILGDILRKNDIGEVVLEFKMDLGHFKIIDWDTNIGVRAML
jgi:hypothetical protein